MNCTLFKLDVEGNDKLIGKTFDVTEIGLKETTQKSMKIYN